MSAAWPAPVAQRPVRATVTLPGSKSLTNRALVLAALADGPSRLVAPLRSRDTLLMAAGLRALGATVRDEGADWQVSPGELRAGPGARVDCGLAGTVARFLPPVAALAQGSTCFVGEPRMSERPLAPLIRALRAAGADIDGDAIPITVRGTGSLAGGSVGIDASPSSQFVSGLLLSAARFQDGLDLVHTGPPVPSAIQVEMTVALLREHGVNVQAGEHRWQVSAGPIRALDRVIEPDLSSASAFLAAAAATGGEVTIPGWPGDTTQPGRRWPALLEQLGARCSRTAAGLTVHGGERITGLDADLRDFSEAVPTLVALAVLAHGPSRLRGVGHMRGQESDRLAALATELGRLGARIEVDTDELAVFPAPLTTGGRAVLSPRSDHRLAMAFAVVGLVVPGVTIWDVDTAGKTVPGFTELWSRMLGG
ncbi:MAG: 3-phosphoshikimate 1-carboxyvinyltransferase [Mycobacteriales bacterium]